MATPAKKKSATRKAASKKKASTRKPASKPKAATKPKPALKAKPLSLIDAAAQVLGASKDPMACKAIVEEVMAKKLWAPSQGGKTPHATLYSSIVREINTKGADARFKKVDRGLFTVTKKA